MKLILFSLLATLAFCATNASLDAHNGWILLPGTIPDEIREEFKANLTSNANNGRIAYGWRAWPDQFPFMAWIHMLLEGNWIISCGATLISRDFMLSAAHCTSLSIRGIDTWVGSIDRQAFPTFREAISHLNHPQYGRGSFSREHDISIIRLSGPVSERPVVLPRRSTINVNYQGVTMVTAGWGQDENGQHSQFLLYTQIVGTQPSNCGTNVQHSDNFICGRGVGNSRIGGSDFGGPLLTTDNILLGVTSFWGNSNSRDDGFTRVDRYLDWIGSNTGIVIQ